MRRSAAQLDHLEQQRSVPPVQMEQEMARTAAQLEDLEKARSVPPQVEQLREMARSAAQLLGI